MNDTWDDVLYRIEQEHGLEKAQQVSDLIDEGVINCLIDEVIDV